MREIVETHIPGRPPIALTSFYEEMRDYYPGTELETKRWFVDNVRRDWWIFDIGANIGYYSILFAQLAPEGRVLAFEPTSTVTMLRENLAYNNVANVDVHQVALGARTGLREDRIFRIWGKGPELKAYRFYKLDDFVAEHKPSRIDCLKVDVDSFDFDVLRGAEEVLRRWNPFIVVELNYALQQRQQSAGEAFEWLAGLGYRKALVLDHDNFALHREDDADPGAGGERSLKLVFSLPVAIEETIEAVEGSPLPDLFPGRVRLQNGASIQRRPPAVDRATESKHPSWLVDGIRKLSTRGRPHSPRDVERAAIMNATIETSPVAWDYAVLFDADVAVTARMPPGSQVTVEVSVGVDAGKVGIAWLDADCTTFSSSERFLSAMPCAQQIVVSAPAERARHLVLRNTALEGTTTRFTVQGIRTKGTHLSPRD